MKKFWIGFISGILFSFIAMIVLGYFLGRAFYSDDDGLSSPTFQKQDSLLVANYNLKLVDLKNDALFKNDLLYGKVVFFNFWEHWCKPCKEELPSIQRLYNTVNDSLIVFAIISTEKPEVAKKDKVVLETNLPFYYLNGVLPDLFKGDIVPRTFIIGKKGEIIIKEIGAAAWDDEKVVELIDSLKAIP